jgi:non-specific serine/threonine protein kinase
LPVELTSFIDREHATAELTRRLATSHLVTLTGPPGVGKTRLALHLAANGVETYPGGVWLVELAAFSDPGLVESSVATALGVREQHGATLADVLADALRLQKMLLVLDNCEHLIGACAVVVDRLLRACPDLRILATSRQALCINGEAVWPVPPLAAIDEQSRSDAGLSRAAPAVRLFVERALATDPSFQFTEQDAHLISCLCCELDGLPLAIELAAARTAALGLSQIAARLGDRFAILTGGSRSSLPRQQTLLAAVDWSYDLLSEPERLLFRRLSVFSGGWTLEAAEGICSDTDLHHGQVIEELTHLVAKSLVTVEQHGQAVRYRLLETLREYGARKLRESGEEAALRRRHLDWFTSWGESGFQELFGTGAATRLVAIEREHDNIRAALSWSKEEPARADVGLRLASSVFRLWDVRGHYAEGIELLEGLLAVAQEDDVWRGNALAELGRLEFLRGNYGAARRHLEASQQCAACLRVTPATAFLALASLMGLGDTALQEGEFATATAHFERGLSIAREVDSRLAVGSFHILLAEAALVQNDHTRAGSFLNDGLAALRSTGEPWSLAWGLSTFGLVAAMQGNLERAAELLGYSFELWEELGDGWGVANCLDRVAYLEITHRRAEKAALLYGVADAVRQRIGVADEPKFRSHRQGVAAEARRQLGDAAYLAALEQGRRFPLDQIRHVVLASPSAATSEPAPSKDKTVPADGLTPREHEVADLVACGYSNRQIADELVITERTAANHVGNILGKLGFHTRAEIASWISRQQAASARATEQA